MKTVTLENIGEILQHIYDSEIHLRLWWLWDGGVDYSFQPFWRFEDNGVTVTGEDKMVRAFEWIIKDILETYPNSGFARWWREEQL